MGFYVLDAVVKRSRASGRAYRLLTLIAERADNKTGQCWPGLRYWSRGLGIRIGDVKPLCDTLVKLGELKVKARYKRGSSGERTTNLYTVTIGTGPPYREPNPDDIPDNQLTGGTT